MNAVKKIMIVDDDPAILDSIGLLLEFEGYHVTATSNAAGLLNMETELPDLVLLDVRNGRMRYLQTLKGETIHQKYSGRFNFSQQGN
jgi:CheY-like chemotaxis protein